MFWVNQEWFLISQTAEVDLLQLCDHNQVAQHQQSNSGLHCFIATTKDLTKKAASFCYIHSRSTTGSLRPCRTNVKLIFPRKLFFLVSWLLRPLSIKILSQSSTPQCSSNTKWAWNEILMTIWPLQNFLWQLR